MDQHQRSGQCAERTDSLRQHRGGTRPAHRWHFRHRVPQHAHQRQARFQDQAAAERGVSCADQHECGPCGGTSLLWQSQPGGAARPAFGAARSSAAATGSEFAAHVRGVLPTCPSRASAAATGIRSGLGSVHAKSGTCGFGTGAGLWFQPARQWSRTVRAYSSSRSSFISPLCLWHPTARQRSVPVCVFTSCCTC